MGLIRNLRAELAEKQLEIMSHLYEEQIARLEKAHAETISRVIEERDRLRDDIQRLQFVIQPSLQQVVTVSDRKQQEERESNAPPVEAVPTGTPWQRIQARWAKQQEEEAKTATEKAMELAVKKAAEAAAAKGNDGSGQPVQGSH